MDDDLSSVDGDALTPGDDLGDPGSPVAELPASDREIYLAAAYNPILLAAAEDFGSEPDGGVQMEEPAAEEMARRGRESRRFYGRRCFPGNI